MGETVHVRATAAQIRQAVLQAPGVARNGGPIADAMMTRCGLAILGRIRDAFVIKSRGGVDAAGDSWPPLSPKTIAYSKTRIRGRFSRTKAERARPHFPSQALNSRQQARWWAVYRHQLAIYKGDKSHAAAVAWIILKQEGTTTLIAKYGGRAVEILRDRGLLLNSLSPGISSTESVFRVGPGEVIVGTNRKWAGCHHRGTRTIPQRRLWPAPSRWPNSWWSDIMDQARQGILDIAAFLIRRIVGP